MRNYLRGLLIVLEQVVPRVRRTREFSLLRVLERDKLGNAHSHALAYLFPLLRHEDVSYRHFASRKLGRHDGRPKHLREALKVYVFEQVLRLGLQNLNDSVGFRLLLNGFLFLYELHVVLGRLFHGLRSLLLLRRVDALQYWRDRQSHSLLLLSHGSNKVKTKY